MLKLFSLRVAAAAVGLVALAVLLLSLDPFLGAVPFAGAATNDRTPPVSVNRVFKGDRLPVVHTDLLDTATPDQTKSGQPAPGLEPRAQMPTGCDPAFSPIFTSKGDNVYRRCTT